MNAGITKFDCIFKRLSNCDRVVFMDSKRIVGFETHENLLNECEAYALFCNQISSAGNFTNHGKYWRKLCIHVILHIFQFKTFLIFPFLFLFLIFGKFHFVLTVILI